MPNPSLVKSWNRFRESYNPLRNLTMARAVSIMEQAQRGMMADLQWLYAAETGIEATDPDLYAIIERTVSGISDMDWHVVTADEDAVGFDAKLAEEQKDFLAGSYSKCDNLAGAIEHLAMARFRGFAHLQPWLKEDWTIEHLEPLPQWNMVRDGIRTDWAWNPQALQKSFLSLGPDAILTPDQYVVLDNRRPVNRIALIKYVRATTSEKDWDGYVEIYGLPGVFVIMPAGIPQGEEEKYRADAIAAAEAASGALPNGSDVKTLSEVRGVQPFQMRLEWLQKQLVLAGTGGLLTMLSEPTGIGGGSTGSHDAVWQTIVRRAAKKIEQALVEQYDRRALAAFFPGRPALASFALRTKQEKNVGEAVQNISALASAGYQVDPKQVEEETGYAVTLKPQPEMPQTPGFRQPTPDNPAPAVDDVAATALNGAQVTSMVELLKQAAAGQIPKDSILPILQAAFPNVSEETIREIVGPLDTFNATEAITRARMKCRDEKKKEASEGLAATLEEILAEAMAEEMKKALSKEVE